MSTPTTADLRALHEDYVWAVNAAVALGDEALVEQLDTEYADEALRLMTSPSVG